MNSGTEQELTERLKQSFRCQRCGSCCCRHGIVRLTEPEIQSIAAYLGMTEYRFTEQYTELLPDRSALTLTELENGDCIFFDADAGCRINSVKPEQCRAFPYRWRFRNWENECEGAKAMGLDKEQVQK